MVTMISENEEFPFVHYSILVGVSAVIVYLAVAGATIWVYYGETQ